MLLFGIHYVYLDGGLLMQNEGKALGLIRRHSLQGKGGHRHQYMKLHEASHITHRLLIANRRYTLTLA